MIIHFHNWSSWKTVYDEIYQKVLNDSTTRNPVSVTRVIVQRKTCCVCNKIKERVERNNLIDIHNY